MSIKVKSSLSVCLFVCLFASSSRPNRTTPGAEISTTYPTFRGEGFRPIAVALRPRVGLLRPKVVPGVSVPGRGCVLRKNANKKSCPESRNRWGPFTVPASFDLTLASEAAGNVSRANGGFQAQMPLIKVGDRSKLGGVPFMSQRPPTSPVEAAGRPIPWQGLGRGEAPSKEAEGRLGPPAGL